LFQDTASGVGVREIVGIGVSVGGRVAVEVSREVGDTSIVKAGALEVSVSSPLEFGRLQPATNKPSPKKVNKCQKHLFIPIAPVLSS
jgi:hypothetical protein